MQIYHKQAGKAEPKIQLTTSWA